MTKNEIEIIFCNKCLKETNHEKHYFKKISGSDKGVDWYNLYQVLECRGCSEFTFRDRLWFSEWQDYPDEPDEPYTPHFEDKYYPPRFTFDKPDWFGDLENENLYNVMLEVYNGLQHGIKVLTAIGLRTALDIVMVDKIGDNGTFQNQLKLFKEEGYITEKIENFLNIAIDFGSAAAHRGYAPHENDIKLVLHIVETLIHDIYFAEFKKKELENKMIELDKKIPKKNNLKNKK